MQVYVIGSRTGRSYELLSKLVKCHYLSSLERFNWAEGDLLVSMGYMKKIPPSVYKNVPTINVHPGWTYPGKHPQLRALANFSREWTDVTLHRVESDTYDVGEVLARQEVKITEADRDDPNTFFERTRRIGVYLTAAWLIGQGVEMR